MATTLPEGVLEEAGIEQRSLISLRRGALSKKSRSWVMKSASAVPGSWWNLNTLRFGRFPKGSCATRVRLNSCKGERSPLKSVAGKEGARLLGVRSISSFLRSGVEREKCSTRSGMISGGPETLKELSRPICGTTRWGASRK